MVTSNAGEFRIREVSPKMAFQDSGLRIYFINCPDEGSFFFVQCLDIPLEVIGSKVSMISGLLHPNIPKFICR